jgi:hypothetical protein
MTLEEWKRDLQRREREATAPKLSVLTPAGWVAVGKVTDVKITLGDQANPYGELNRQRWRRFRQRAKG